MSSPFQEITNLDRLVHEPARLAILTALDACRHADFMYLQSLTGLAKGNLHDVGERCALALDAGFLQEQHDAFDTDRETAGRRRLEQTRKAAAGWTGQLRRAAAQDT